MLQNGRDTREWKGISKPGASRLYQSAAAVTSSQALRVCTFQNGESECFLESARAWDVQYLQEKIIIS